MDKKESPIKAVRCPLEELYGTLSDMSKIGELLSRAGSAPGFDASRVSCTAEGLAMEVPQVGRVTLSIEQATPQSLVKYALHAPVPVKAELFAQMMAAPAPNDTTESRLKLTLKADIPFMLKPLIGGKLQEVVDVLAQKMAETLGDRV